MKYSNFVRGVGAPMLATLATGCVYLDSPFLPPLGSGMTDIGVPVDTTFDRTVMGDRVGRSASHCLFGLFAWGDATVSSAARDADIHVIDHIDGDITIVLFGLYSQYEIVVSGQKYEVVDANR